MLWIAGAGRDVVDHRAENVKTPGRTVSKSEFASVEDKGKAKKL
jgi:hypothetical protein